MNFSKLVFSVFAMTTLAGTLAQAHPDCYSDCWYDRWGNYRCEHRCRPHHPDPAPIDDHDLAISASLLAISATTLFARAKPRFSCDAITSACSSGSRVDGAVVRVGAGSFVLSFAYTEALLRSMPRLDRTVAGDMPTIGGQPPNLQRLPKGCAFQERCTRAVATGEGARAPSQRASRSCVAGWRRM